MLAPEGIFSKYDRINPVTDPVMPHNAARGMILAKFLVKSIAVICGMVKMLNTRMMPMDLMLITIARAMIMDIK